MTSSNAPMTSPLVAELNRLLEDRCLVPPVGVEHPPPLVFIVGVPRSGTTLLAQIISIAFEVAYVDNVAAKFWGAPAVGVALSAELNPFAGRRESNFHSHMGFTYGPFEPNEFGYFWRRFFDYSEAHQQTDRQLGAIPLTRMRHELAAASAGVRLPLMLKNPVAISLNVDALAKLFPDAYFIFCSRDRVSTAVSILNQRRHLGDVGRWFSAKPIGFDELLDRPPHEQVAGQVVLCERVVDTAYEWIARDRPARCFRIRYEDYCADPTGFLRRLEEGFRAAGISVESKSIDVEPIAVCAHSESGGERRQMEEALTKYA